MVGIGRISNNLKSIAFTIFLLILTGIVALVAAPHMLPARDFDQTFYPAGRYVLMGENPYTAEYSETDQGAPPDFFSPPWMIPILLPFSLFSLELARAFWVIFLVGVTVTAIALMRPWGLRGYWPIALAVLPWSLIGILFGQVTALVLLGAVICIGELKREEDGSQSVLKLLAGFLLIGLKPHLGLLIGSPIFLWLLWRRDKRLLPLIVLGLLIIVLALLLTPLGLLQNMSNVQQIASHWQSTLERELTLWKQPLWIAHIIRIFVVGTMICWVWRRRLLDFVWSSAWLAAVLIITPYTRAYDGVLLLPLLGLMVSLRRRQIAIFLLIIFLYIQLPNSELGSVVTPLAAWMLFVPWRSLLSSQDAPHLISQY